MNARARNQVGAARREDRRRLVLYFAGESHSHEKEWRRQRIRVARFPRPVLIRRSVDAGALANAGADPSTASQASDQIDGGPAREVEAAFVERLGDAKIDVPNMQAGEYRLAAHCGEKCKCRGFRFRPMSRVTRRASRCKRAMKRRSGPCRNPTAACGHRAPKVWNIGERRRVRHALASDLSAPTPATFSFRVTIPPDATFEFAPAIVEWINPTTEEPVRGSPKEVTFAVVIDAGHGEEEPVCDKTISLIETPTLKGWQDASCDLAKWSGRDVELRLQTTSPKGRDVAALALWGKPDVARQTPNACTIQHSLGGRGRHAARRAGELPRRRRRTRKMRHARFDPGFALLPKIHPGLMPTWMIYRCIVHVSRMHIPTRRGLGQARSR